MSEWIKEFRTIGLEIFGRESSGEMWAMVVLCVFIGFLLYKKMSSGFEGRGEKTFLTLIPGVFIMVVAVAAVRIYLGGTFLLQVAVVGVCFLVIVLPITMRVEKTRYFTAMIPWGVTVLVLAAILYLEPLIMQSLSRGVEKGSLMKDHRDDVESIFD
jgi:hypothetical protein